MHTDPATPIFVAIVLAVLIFSFVMKKFKQPHVVGYLIVGILLGPNLLGVIHDQETLSRLGSIGVILLLFFVGMEVSPRRLAKNWVISVGGTLLQVIVSVGVIALVGWIFDWSWARIVLLGFVISLSSTAVVLKLLQDWQEIDTRVGQDVIGILLLQDLIVIPMLIVLGFMGGSRPSIHVISLQIIGGILVLAIAIWITIKDEIRLPILKQLGHDHESQVFLSLMLCFGLAMITGLFDLSEALGAFLAGMIVSSARETNWVHQSLLPLRTIFIALFFIAIGMLIDLRFIVHHFWQISLLVIAALTTNTLINALLLKCLGESWRVSIYGGSLLAQIGEFSFVIASVGYQQKLLVASAYQLTITTIALTLLLSPLWIMWIKSLTDRATMHLKRMPAHSEPNNH